MATLARFKENPPGEMQFVEGAKRVECTGRWPRVYKECGHGEYGRIRQSSEDEVHSGRPVDHHVWSSITIIGTTSSVLALLHLSWHRFICLGTALSVLAKDGERKRCRGNVGRWRAKSEEADPSRGVSDGYGGVNGEGGQGRKEGRRIGDSGSMN